MSESEIPAVIAQQEEYLKRIETCQGMPLTRHAFRDFGRPAKDGSTRNAVKWRECIRCGVTETDADYFRKIGR